MKKLLAIVLVVLVAIAALPFVGNKIIDSEIKKQMDILTSHGIEVSESKISSSYFHTTKHYELTIKNSDKFSDYLSNFSNSQIPPYLKEMLEGTKLATDIEYYNVPVNFEVVIDMYPLELSNKMMENIKKDDPKLAIFVKEFFQKGGLTYHLNLNVKTKEFKGFIKDIDETYTTKKGSEIKAKLKGTTYSGKGNVFIPEFIDSKIEHLSIDAKDDTQSVNLLLKNISTLSTFESRSTYATNLKCQNISVKTTGAKEDIDFDLTNSFFDISSNAKGQKAEVNLKTTFDKMDINSAKEKFALNDFVFDMAFKNIDKDAFEKLINTINDAQTDDSAKMQLQIKQDVENVLSRGIDIKIPDLSVKSISMSDTKSLRGFSLNSLLVLPPNVLTSHVRSPLQIMDKIKLEFFLKISKDLFTKMSNSSPMVAITKGYAKDLKDDLVYDVKLDKGSININGKVIR